MPTNSIDVEAEAARCPAGRRRDPRTVAVGAVEVVEFAKWDGRWQQRSRIRRGTRLIGIRARERRQMSICHAGERICVGAASHVARRNGFCGIRSPPCRCCIAHTASFLLRGDINSFKRLICVFQMLVLRTDSGKQHGSMMTNGGADSRRRQQRRGHGMRGRFYRGHSRVYG